MKYPITVNRIEFSKDELLEKTAILSPATCGDWVAVRPCDKELKGRTYLGVFLGALALSQTCELGDDGTLTVGRTMHNPMMYVPDLKRVVYGCGSFWRRLKTPDDLKSITNIDINDTWYVRALRELEQCQREPAHE